MKNIVIVICFLIIPNLTIAGGMNDDPLLTMMMIDQLEIRTVEGKDPLVWDAEGWIGKDLHKFWFKTEGEFVDNRVEEGEFQTLYSRAVIPFWDVQVGWRRNFRPEPDHDWLALGLKGLSPYMFDIDAALFIGESGQSSARLQAEYEIMMTQRLILVPEIEMNLYGKDDPETEIGSGLANLEAGLRLRYEIRREFAPYIGLNWTKLFGDTADFAREEGKDTDDIHFVFGIRTWF